MRLKPTSRAEFCESPRNMLYLAYVERVGELAQPKHALKVLRDDVRMQAYAQAIERNVKGALLAPSSALPFHSLHNELGARVAVLESGGGVLPVLCAKAGAASVTGANVGCVYARAREMTSLGAMVPHSH